MASWTIAMLRDEIPPWARVVSFSAEGGGR
jgi:hypothetical protein